MYVYRYLRYIHLYLRVRVHILYIALFNNTAKSKTTELCKNTKKKKKKDSKPFKVYLNVSIPTLHRYSYTRKSEKLSRITNKKYIFNLLV